MSLAQRKITPADILSDADYNARRKDLRAASIEEKKDRRMEVGPYATLYFENYTSMWLQVQEMLRIEKGGVAQIEGELEAYNPLIPQGAELIATMMIEIEDADRRDRELRKLGHIEDTVFLDVGKDRIKATPTDYEDRTTADGKTSSVHWLRFTFSPEQIAAFRAGKEPVVIGMTHANYGHMAVMPANVRVALAGDFA
ncbi:MAG: DUF3501 family protein [Alphaproteobacteria bacterium]|nr:DUF3501 family protein [Alphaproteobacteria bacterium]MBL6937454.1 DUF3501 family protein [Alphaproteobacteria bacterium]MBL7098792.1 DUF3501 family protein [Alphaproteobacteria bacterium]